MADLNFIVLNAITDRPIAAFMLLSDAKNFIASLRGPHYEIVNADESTILPVAAGIRQHPLNHWR